MAKILHNIEQYKETLKNVLLRFASVPEDELNYFLDLFYVQTFKKKEILIGPGNTEIKGFFIIKGIVRMFYVAEGKEIISDFREPNSFFLNGFTKFTGLPNFDTFVALEETVCLVIDWNQLEIALAKYHSLEHLGRRIVEWHYAESIRVSYNSLFLSAEERFFTFMKERALLLEHVSQKYIASYLGLTPETFSRLRSKHQL